MGFAPVEFVQPIRQFAHRNVHRIADHAAGDLARITHVDQLQFRNVGDTLGQRAGVSREAISTSPRLSNITA